MTIKKDFSLENIKDLIETLLVDIFIIHDIDSKVKAKLIVRLLNTINHECPDIDIEATAYNLISQLDPNNDILKQNI